MKRIIDFLKSNHNWLMLVVTMIVGFSSIIATIVNAFLVIRQNDISMKLKSLQEKQNQPVFSISIQHQRDSVDGIYGDEFFIIKNIGHIISEPCQVDMKVYFKLRKNIVGKDENVLYFPVNDYYNYGVLGKTGMKKCIMLMD